MTDETFERAKACYDQNFMQMRSLNEQMVRIPTISVTVTGGVWFAVGTSINMKLGAAFTFLLFVGLINVGLTIICVRTRDVISSYLEKIKSFSADNFASGKPKKPTLPLLASYSMITTYTLLMLTACWLSFFLALEFYWPGDVASCWLSILRTMLRLICYLLPVIFAAVLIKSASSQDD